MSNLRQQPKPSEDITNFEWERTPYSVQIFIARLRETLREKGQTIDNLSFENNWLRGELDSLLDRGSQVQIPSLPEVILWGLIGFILTVGGTFVQAHSISAPWFWGSQGIKITTLGVTYQIGAVLLTGCLGGKNAALLAQVAYVTLGLMGVPLFTNGGGLQYVLEPHFGYLLGFVVGAWLCGYLAFKNFARIELLFFSCLMGLLGIHLIGIIYLTVLHYVYGSGEGLSLLDSISLYSLAPLLGQLAVICGVTLVSWIMRKVMLS